jgi:GT2 family glycosyltransferase
MSAMDLTVVILNWNTADLTIRSVTSLESDGVPRGRIVVVDNASTDDSVERFERELDGVILVRVEQNMGFARAANRGARTLPGSSFLFVNSDAFLHRPGSVGRMVAALENKHVGIVAPRVLNMDGTLQPSVVPLTTPGVALIRASGASRLVPNRWQPSWSTHWDHSSSREIQAANGAVLLVRAATFDALDGFDERLHIYAEELDLFWRARKLGWCGWFVHDAEFLHVGAGSTGGNQMDPVRVERIGRSEAAMLRRNLSPGASRLTLAFMAGGLRARRAWFRLRRNGPAAAEMEGSLRGLTQGRGDDSTVTRPARGT